MKKRLLILISVIFISIIGTGLFGYSFFNVRFNFYNSCHAIYTKTDVFTPESKLKGTILSKREDGIWISKPVYFEFPKFVQGEKYTLEIFENEHSLGKVDFSFK